MASRILYIPRERPRRRRFSISIKSIFAVVGAVVFSAVIVGAIYVLRLPQLQIKEIRFSGLEALVEKELTDAIWKKLEGEYVFFIPRRSIILAGGNALGGELQSVFPRIKNVSLRKVFPRTLEISVEERKIFGILCGQSQCAYIDISGFAYETAPNSTGSLILKIQSDVDEITVGSQAVEPVLMERFGLLGEELKKIGLEVIGYEISQKNPRDIRAKTSEGFEIIFNRDDDFQSIFRVLKSVLDEEIRDKRSKIEYIDLRFGNKVFYK